MKNKKLFAILGMMILAGSGTIQAQQGFGTNKPEHSAAVDITSTTQGFLPPRMTNAEVEAIQHPADGLVVYNTTLQCLMYYTMGVFTCAFATPTPAHANARPYFPRFTNTVAGTNVGNSATTSYTAYDVDGDPLDTPTYRWYRCLDTSGSSNVPIDNATAATYTFTSTDVGYYIQAGATATVKNNTTPGTEQLASTYLGPIVSCGGTLTIIHTEGTVAPVTKTVSYGTVFTNAGGTGEKCWITQNLGASKQASDVEDYSDSSAGWYWQYNCAQGHVIEGDFFHVTTIKPDVLYSTTPNPNTPWSSTTDPCSLLLGSTWRLPTYQELASAAGNIFSAPLYVHYAGHIGLGTVLSSGLRSTFEEYNFYAVNGYDTNGNYYGVYKHQNPMLQKVTVNDYHVCAPARCIRDD